MIRSQSSPISLSLPPPTPPPPSHPPGQWHQRGALHSRGSGEYKMPVISSLKKTNNPPKTYQSASPPRLFVFVHFVPPDSPRPHPPSAGLRRCAPETAVCCIHLLRLKAHNEHFLSSKESKKQEKGEGKKKRGFFFPPWQVVTLADARARAARARGRSRRQMFLLTEGRCIAAPAT